MYTLYYDTTHIFLVIIYRFIDFIDALSFESTML